MQDYWESYYKPPDYVSAATGSTRPFDGQMGWMDDGAYPTPRSSYTLHNPYVNDSASATGSTTPQSSYPVRVPPHQSETRRPIPSSSSLSPPAYSSAPSSSSTHHIKTSHTHAHRRARLPEAHSVRGHVAHRGPLCTKPSKPKPTHQMRRTQRVFRTRTRTVTLACWPSTEGIFSTHTGCRKVSG